jgi:hypothetical protein
MKSNNINLIHLFFVHLRALDFYKAWTLCNEFTAHRFVTLDHGFTTPKLRFDTQVMITCLLPSVGTVLIPMLQFTPCYTTRLRRRKYLYANTQMGWFCLHSNVHIWMAPFTNHDPSLHTRKNSKVLEHL